VSVACLLVILVWSGCARPRPAVPSRRPVEAIDQLRRDLAAITARPGVSRAAWGIVVHSLDRDDRLYGLNADTLLVPASAAKLVSVASAAEAVGWNYTFETTVRATGPVVDGVLRGDLLIVGTGDPSIGGRGGGDLGVWVEALKARGISRIEGRVIGDDDLVEEPRPALAWAWDDLGYATGVLFGALNVAENRMTVTVEAGAAAGSPTTLAVDPGAMDRPLSNASVTGLPGSALLLWPEQRPGDPFLTIAGSMPAGGPSARLTVSAGNPTLWFARTLRSRLLAAGIDVTGEALDIDDVRPVPNRDEAEVLYTYRSPPLASLVQPLLKESINLYGEAVMRLNAAPGVLATNDAALEGLGRRLEAWGIGRSAQQLIDGSGLSRRNVISPQALVTVLRRMHDPTGASPFVRALSSAGVDGSLEQRMRGTPAEGNVRAKTGTMSNIRALAGYVTSRDGERLAFAVIANNFEGTGAQATEAVDAIAIRLASFAR
jgi:D-alanyl-D-alanine carboxypeptidase/D-alanyl-D-alanine-endopeptidase (penicillin-binding protein 4)